MALTSGQKAPNAKRCIKTIGIREIDDVVIAVSESTERQKVH